MNTTITRISTQPDRFQLDVIFQESLKAGLYTSDILLEPITADGQRLPHRILNVRGKVLPDIQLFPASLKFGSRPVGQTAEELMTLRSASGDPIIVEGFEAESKDVVIEPIVRTKAESPVFRILFHITRPGHSSIPIRFVAKKKCGESFTVLSEISCYGVSK